MCVTKDEQSIQRLLELRVCLDDTFGLRFRLLFWRFDIISPSEIESY
jgi:hypothetical protein